MAPKKSDIDISENRLRNRGRVLDILLSVRNTKRNIIWATDSYNGFKPKSEIKREQITGKNGMLIQPRASKSKEEQKIRTKDKAEVFTPLDIVEKMNSAIDESSQNYPITKDNWIDFIKERRLEITCGEGPFIAGRYNPTSSSRKVINPKNRVGFLDHKLRVVSTHTKNKKDWLKYAEIALQSCYGYEWQGDNLLIARENILLTMNDFYEYFCANKLKLKTKQRLNDSQLEHFASIIAWNFWQMDGLKYVVPMSCKQSLRSSNDNVSKNQQTLFVVEKPKKILAQCEGCRTNNPTLHTGKYSIIKDWETDKKIKFVDMIKSDY